MKAKHRYEVSFENDRNDVNLPAFLDMLRFDGASVITWTTVAGTYGKRYICVLEADHYNDARWKSMGMKPAYLGKY